MELEDKLRKRFLDSCKEAYEELRISFTTFNAMLVTHGAVKTAKILLRNPIQSGFITLAEKGRFDLTMESIILEKEFQVLFSQDELKIAAQRLKFN